MEKDLRRSTRSVKPLRDPAFVYDEDSVRILNQESSVNCDTWQLRQSSEDTLFPASDSPVDRSSEVLGQTSVSSWSALLNLPNYNNTCANSEQLVTYDPKEYIVFKPSSSPNTSEFEGEWEVTSYVNKSQCVVDQVVGDVSARTSSTRYDLLEKGDDLFLSVSSSVRSDTSDTEMDKLDTGMKSCECGIGESCELCSASSLPVHNREHSEHNRELSEHNRELPVHNGEPTDDSELLVQLMTSMLKKVNSISDEVKSVKRTVSVYGNRLKAVEEQVSGGSDMSDGFSSKKKQQLKANEVQIIGGSVMSDSCKSKNISYKKQQSGQVLKSTEKLSHVLKEKERQLNVLLDKIETNQDSESSDDELNLGKVNKKMSSKQKAKREQRVEALLAQVGGSFPDEDYSASGSSGSGTDSDSGKKKKSRSRGKVKSGANVKNRPVIRTELWPHTIANEDDGEDVTSDTIKLAKFLACYSYIMINCGEQEFTGRAVLLHAIASVLECMPWSEARTFHNLVMVKIEQGRIDWATDFTEIGEQFLNKKVRQNLRPKSTASSSGSSAYSGYGKGFGSQNSYGRSRYNRNEFPAGRNRATISDVCRQWNAGTCSYGADCKKWHCCSTCFYGGKPGEKHKSSTHGNSTTNSSPNNQRV